MPKHNVMSEREKKEPYWADEIRENRINYPCRIEFKPIILLSQELWKTKSVRIAHLGPIYFSGINPIVKQELIEKLKNLSDGIH